MSTIKTCIVGIKTVHEEVKLYRVSHVRKDKEKNHVDAIKFAFTCTVHNRDKAR